MMMVCDGSGGFRAGNMVAWQRAMVVVVVVSGRCVMMMVCDGGGGVW